jgi:hypothetical protein
LPSTPAVRSLSLTKLPVSTPAASRCCAAACGAANNGRRRKSARGAPRMQALAPCWTLDAGTGALGRSRGACCRKLLPVLALAAAWCAATLAVARARVRTAVV